MTHTRAREGQFKLRHDFEQWTYLLRKRLLRKTEIAGGESHFYRPRAQKMPAVNPRLNFRAIEADFLSQENPIIVLDRFLSSSALRKLRKLALESTVWQESKYRSHVAARLNSGLACGLVTQIGQELEVRFRRLLEGMELLSVWAFKYGPVDAGIETHADGGSVNFNLWLTPEEANLDPSSGGMVIHHLKRPQSWSLAEVNSRDALPRVRELLRESKAKQVVIPYRFNRAVLFDSRLFHETDRFRFVDSYESRRISLTFMFGSKSAQRR